MYLKIEGSPGVGLCSTRGCGRQQADMSDAGKGLPTLIVFRQRQGVSTARLNSFTVEMMAREEGVEGLGVVV